MQFVQVEDLAPYVIKNTEKYFPLEKISDKKILEFQQEKLLFPGIFKHLFCSLDEKGVACGRIYYLLVEHGNWNKWYLLGLFNSILYKHVYQVLHSLSHLGGNYLRFNSNSLAAMGIPPENGEIIRLAKILHKIKKVKQEIISRSKILIEDIIFHGNTRDHPDNTSLLGSIVIKRETPRDRLIMRTSTIEAIIINYGEVLILSRDHGHDTLPLLRVKSANKQVMSLVLLLFENKNLIFSRKVALDELISQVKSWTSKRHLLEGVKKMHHELEALLKEAIPSGRDKNKNKNVQTLVDLVMLESRLEARLNAIVFNMLKLNKNEILHVLRSQGMLKEESMKFIEMLQKLNQG